MYTGSSRLPHFIVVGAMKAGTSSLHHILSRHHEIFFAEREIYFFDMDDVEQHPDFFMDHQGQWRFQDYKDDCKEQLAYYGRFFEQSIDGQLIGERSSTYMASAKVPPRMARLLPEVKLIFMLRDPVTRAYSHYWHLVSTGRATYDFEATLRHTPGTILQRGYYKKQIERYQKFFPVNHLKFIIFDEFIQDPQSCIDNLCEFLGLRTSIDLGLVDTRRNVGVAPRSLRLKLRENRKNRKAAEEIYRGYLPTLTLDRKTLSSFSRCIEFLSPTRLMSRMASLTPKRHYPPMSDGVREFLERLYARDNMGLGDLIGIEVERFWPYMKYYR